jgi:antitoxin VapB
MALSIKNSETERLAREVARETGESLTEAIAGALKERLQRLKQRHQGRIVTEKLEDILRRVDRLPTLDTRPQDEILGYDEHGVPR